MMVNSMLMEVRRNAGMGEPPSPYYNNIPESANAVIKRAVNFKESEMAKFCHDMSMLLLQQKEDVESAIINKGSYRLSPKFESHEVPQSTWFKVSVKQREKKLKQFHAEKMSKDPDDESTKLSNCAQNIRSQLPITTSLQQKRVSVDLVGSGVRSAPEMVLRSISEKAEKLLNTEGSIVRAPGPTDSFAYMVESQTSEKPHYVTLLKNGKITCEDCPGWKASKICAHAVAAAEKAGTTVKYIKWLREKGPTSMNVTSLITFDSNSSTGKKGGKGSTARRKGGRSSQQAPATNVIDRFVQPPPNPQSPHTIAPPMPFQVPAPATTQSSQNLHFNNYARSPNPKVGTFVVNLLHFCPHLVRSCYGCSQSLKPGGAIANPPYDMTIISRMNRGFRAPPDGEIMFKEGNVYFHVQLSCIRIRQPYFNPQQAEVPNWLMPYLTSEHMQYLREFGLHI